MNDNCVANILSSAKRTNIDHSFPFIEFFLTNSNRKVPAAYAWEPLSRDLQEWPPFEKILLTSLPQLLSLRAPLRCTSVSRIQR